jgi:hypothetical protein
MQLDGNACGEEALRIGAGRGSRSWSATSPRRIFQSMGLTPIAA